MEVDSNCRMDHRRNSILWMVCRQLLLTRTCHRLCKRRKLCKNVNRAWLIANKIYLNNSEWALKRSKPERWSINKLKKLNPHNIKRWSVQTSLNYRHPSPPCSSVSKWQTIMYWVWQVPGQWLRPTATDLPPEGKSQRTSNWIFSWLTKITNWLSSLQQPQQSITWWSKLCQTITFWAI